jgi:hypothetical protein
MLSCCEFDELAGLLGYPASDPETFEVIEAVRQDSLKCVDVVHSVCEKNFQMYLLAIQSGRMVVDQTAWDSCKSTFNEGVSNCSSLTTTYAYNQTCRLNKVMLGNTKPEGLCYMDAECTTGNWCLGGPPGFCAPRITEESGICWDKAKCEEDKHCNATIPATKVCVQVPVQSQDGFCSIDSDCADGLFCDQSTNKCTTKIDPGQKCAKDHQCKSNKCDKVNQKCLDLSDTNQACNSSLECKDSLWCSPTPSIGVCTGPDMIANLGENCDGVLVWCRQGLRCLGGKCTAPVPDGSTCTASSQCADTSYCNTLTSKCTSPRKAADAACANSAECAADLYCDGATDKCKARVKQGDPCTTGSCQTGLWCAVESQTCESQYGNGQKCFESDQCGQGLMCRQYMGLCQSRSGKDSICNTDDECNKELFCNPGDVTKICATKRVAGVNESCTGGSVVCGTDLYCSIFGNVCVPKKDAGGACASSTECKGDLVCGTDSKCRQPAQTGDPCTNSVPVCAKNLYCTGTECQNRLGKGENCYMSDMCQDSLYCDSANTCNDRKGTDATCAANRECQDGMKCDSTSHKCVNLSGQGGTCNSSTDCTTALYCKSASGKCADRYQTSSECPILSGCIRGDACVTKATCADRLDVGSRCETDLDCKKELVCSLEWLECVEPTTGIPTGDHCNAGYECQSGACEDHMCVAVCQGHLHW